MSVTLYNNFIHNKNMSVKISVIVPVYNGEKYIDACINNLLQQTYKDIEIIVIDDGSTDNSCEAAKKYPVTVFHQENKGSSAARNAGIDLATGEYIHFMDVDDEINNEFYQNMLSSALTHKADATCCGMVNEPIPHRTLLYSEEKSFISVQDKINATMAGRYGYAVRYLFRTDFIKENNLRFEEGRYIEDLLFTLPAIYFANKVVTVPNTVYTYKKQENSIMSRKDREHKRKRHQDWKYAKKFRCDFARRHGFQIPKVPTKGIGALIMRLFG
jgi:glycosyltransferase involved in cell wall biosynthesis